MGRRSLSRRRQEPARQAILNSEADHCAIVFGANPSRPRPVPRIRARVQITVERGQRPIPNGCGVSMLDRVEMDVIDPPSQIEFIADAMFPVATLPDAPLAATQPRHGSAFALLQSQAEVRLDAPPPGRVVRIVVGQRPDPVHVIRQHHPRHHRERSTRPLDRHAAAQQIEVSYQQIVPPSLQQIDREEPRPARCPVASIVRHVVSLPNPGRPPPSANHPPTRRKFPVSRRAEPAERIPPLRHGRFGWPLPQSWFTSVESAARVPPYGLHLTAFDRCALRPFFEK